MNKEAQKGSLDGYTQATKLNQFNITPEIKQIHVDAIATNNLADQVNHYDVIQTYFNKWSGAAEQGATLGKLTQEQLKSFVTAATSDGGLGLSSSYYEDAYHFSSLQYGLEQNGDWQLFLGDKLSCIGDTSILAILLGAAFLIWTGIGSWRTMVAMALGAFLTASFLEYGTYFFAKDSGAWTQAQFGLPAYKHLLLGGLAFGLVFMATDPVSSPAMKGAKWVYGIFCGIITIVIRTINPAFPEGVMLAILMGNVFAPLFDYYAALSFRKRRVGYVVKSAV
jgi:Na+-transporting NADH:ubiquinone oxidoreductase subunit B